MLGSFYFVRVVLRLMSLSKETGCIWICMQDESKGGKNVERRPDRRLLKELGKR